MMLVPSLVEVAVGAEVESSAEGIKYSSRLTDTLVAKAGAIAPLAGVGIAVDREFGTIRRHRWVGTSWLTMNLWQCRQV